MIRRLVVPQEVAVPAVVAPAVAVSSPTADRLEAARPSSAPSLASAPLPASPAAVHPRLAEACKYTSVAAAAVGAGCVVGALGTAAGLGASAVALGCAAGFVGLVNAKNAVFGRRHDGTLINDSTLMRRIMPYLMRTRTESTVVHEQVLDLSETLPFIEEWNRTHSDRITVFHLVLASICRSADVRPGLDRFVIGGHLYQRKDPSLSFVVKREFKDYSGLRTVKFRAAPHESLENIVADLHSAVGTERTTRKLRPVEKETRFFTNLPGWVLSVGMRAQRFLDRYGLLPPIATENDPLYTSIFAANLGSLGLDRVQHHLYEYGTASLFCSVGEVAKEARVNAAGEVKAVPTVHIHWTFDERINDGHYCAKALRKMGELVEHPDRMLEERTDDEVQANLRSDRQSRSQAQSVEAAGLIPGA